VLVVSVLVVSGLVVSVLVVSVLVVSGLVVSVLVVSVLVALGSAAVAAATEAFVAARLPAFGLAAAGFEVVAATPPPGWLAVGVAPTDVRAPADPRPAGDAAAFGAGAEPRPPRAGVDAPAPRGMGAPGNHVVVWGCDASMPSARLFAITASLRAA
jgi:hypothetical protein